MSGAGLLAPPTYLSAHYLILSMYDEPADPFGADSANVIADAELVWNQLLAMRKWSEFRRAIGALDEVDLRKIVFLHVYRHYTSDTNDSGAA